MPSLGLGLGLHKGVPTFTGLLDYYSGASAAYSLRALSRGWLAGDVVEVRRSEDSVQVKVGLVGGVVTLDSKVTNVTETPDQGDTLAANLGEFVAAPGYSNPDSLVGANDGFVSTWYDQSGNGNDATQATTTSQPKIVDAGALVTGGLDFDGVDDALDAPNDLISSIDSVSNFVIATLDSTTGDGCANALSRNNPDKRFYSPVLTGGSVYQGYGASATAISHGVADLNSHLYSCVAGSVTAEAWKDGLSSGSVVSTSGLNILATGGIGAINVTTYWNGKIAEIIVYPTDESANRVGIETNINDHYSIYA